MNKLFSNFYDFVTALLVRLQRQDGQTMAEYGILIGVIALIVVVAATALGGGISGLFSSASTSL